LQKDAEVPQVKPLPKVLLALYLLILLWLVLFKFSIHVSSVLDQTRSLNLIPFAGTSRVNLKQVVYNFVVFIPLGLLLSVNLKRATFWQKLALVLTLSVACETVQFVFAIGATDITDVITNTSGSFLGLLAYYLCERRVDTKKLDQRIVVIGTILLIFFIVLLGILLSHGVRYQSAPAVGGHRLRT
jgi:glycopeptide antibiotics resistance protein